MKRASLVPETSVRLGAVPLRSASGNSHRNSLKGLDLAPLPALCVLSRSSLLMGVAAIALLALSPRASAAPVGGSVVSGSATISSSGTTTNINQSTNKAIINWQSFSTASNETVNFNQPSSSSVTLNRVIGNEASVLNGVLNANGQVFLVNSAGVLIGKGASVNTAGFAASTQDISNADFNAGKYSFSGASSASVINLGTITVTGDTTTGGYVVLLGKTVSNQGTIIATKGTVALAGGNQMTLNFDGNSLVSVTVDRGVLDALVENKKAIYADGGKVILTAKAADDLLSAQVNNDGLVQAQTIGDLKGDIKLLAEGGTTNVAGTLDASAPNGGNGGQIETSGDHVKVADGATVTTKAASGQSGTWTIDPTDFTITSGGAAQTTSGIGADTLHTALENGSVAITTSNGGSGNGDVNVNAAVTWDVGTSLSLTAIRNVNVNSAITASGNGAGLTLTATNGSLYDNAAITMSGNNSSLALNANTTSGIVYINNAVTLSGDSNDALTINAKDYSIRTKASYSGTTSDGTSAQTDTSGGTYGSVSFTSGQGSASGDSLTINGQTYSLIYNMSDLVAISGTSTRYALAGNLNANANLAGRTTSGTDTNGNTYYYYTSSPVSTFSGTLAGLGHTIDKLTISSTSSKVGLVGTASGTGTTFRDLGLTNASITTSSTYAGALIGYISGGSVTVNDVYSAGGVSSTSYTGGLIGYNAGTLNLTYSSSSAAISGSSSYKGGLIGQDLGTSTIEYSDATGPVTGYGYLGGLVGYGYSLTLDHSYATGSVTGSSGDYEGGLIGYLNIRYGSTPSFAASNIFDSFATGNVTGAAHVGGLIGIVTSSYSTTPTVLSYVTINDTYATGTVTATATDGSNSTTGSYAGGLIGEARFATISNSHATGNVTSTAPASGNYVGGLIGNAYASAISNSYATGNVSSTYGQNVGGLVGQVQAGAIGVGTRAADGSYASYNTLGGSVSGSYATGTVTGAEFVGGLVGTLAGTEKAITSSSDVNPNYIAYSSVTNSSASGKVTASSTGYVSAGGLIGYASDAIVSGSSASGAVSGTSSASVNDSISVGGLVGSASNTTISGSSAKGDVSANGTGASVGGLVGSADFSTITNSSATGSGATDVSGYNRSTTIANSTYQDVKAQAAVLQTQKTTAANIGSSIVSSSQSNATSGETVGQSKSSPPAEAQVVSSLSIEYSADVTGIEVNGVQYELKDTNNKQEK